MSYWLIISVYNSDTSDKPIIYLRSLGVWGKFEVNRDCEVQDSVVRGHLKNFISSKRIPTFLVLVSETLWWASSILEAAFFQVTPSYVCSFRSFPVLCVLSGHSQLCVFFKVIPSSVYCFRSFSVMCFLSGHFQLCVLSSHSLFCTFFQVIQVVFVWWNFLSSWDVNNIKIVVAQNLLSEIERSATAFDCRRDQIFNAKI